MCCIWCVCTHKLKQHISLQLCTMGSKHSMAVCTQSFAFNYLNVFPLCILRSTKIFNFILEGGCFGKSEIRKWWSSGCIFRIRKKQKFGDEVVSQDYEFHGQIWIIKFMKSKEKLTEVCSVDHLETNIKKTPIFSSLSQEFNPYSEWLCKLTDPDQDFRFCRISDAVYSKEYSDERPKKSFLTVTL